METFNEIGLRSELLQAINELGFVKPTPVQEKAIPFLLENDRDLIGLAQTGTGKTAAFGLPLIQKLDENTKTPQALILCPTRELCLQINTDLEHFTRYLPGIRCVAIYGGASIDRQIGLLKRGVQIVAATPGRMCDVIRRGCVDLSKVSTVVLDEADEMLNMGFQEELNAILAETPKTKNTLLFSATMPDGVARIAANYMVAPYEITAGQKNAGAENVNHRYYMVHAKDRYLALKRIADINPNVYGIVFCRTRRETKEVADKLIHDGYSADALHGDLSQAQRDHVMNKFRKKALHLLVATDVAARGLDIDDLTHIINYNLPEEIELYTHRSGRTGRAGKSGESIAIINMKEQWKIRRIEKLIRKRFERCRVPVGREICEVQLFDLIDRMENVEVDEEQITPFLDSVFKKLEGFDREELIKRFVSLEFNRFLDYYRNAKDLNVNLDDRSQHEKDGKTKKKREKRERQVPKEMTRFFVNIGSKDNIRPIDIINLINENSGKHDINIGDIEVKGRFSFFNVDKAHAEDMYLAFTGVVCNGREVRIDEAVAEDKTPTGKRKKRDAEQRRKQPWSKMNKKPRRQKKGKGRG